MAARGLGKGLDALIPSSVAEPKKVKTKEKEVVVEKNDFQLLNASMHEEILLKSKETKSHPVALPYLCRV